MKRERIAEPDYRFIEQMTRLSRKSRADRFKARSGIKAPRGEKPAPKFNSRGQPEFVDKASKQAPQTTTNSGEHPIPESVAPAASQRAKKTEKRIPRQRLYEAALKAFDEEEERKKPKLLLEAPPPRKVPRAPLARGLTRRRMPPR